MTLAARFTWVGTPWLRGIVFVVSLMPLGFLAWEVLIQQQAPDPVKAVIDGTGLWALRFLWLSLAMTPLRWLTGAPGWIRHRRMLGLFAFFHALLHVTAWSVLLCEGSLTRMGEDIIKHPYVLAGMVAFAALVPLAVTSTRGWQRRLRQRWVSLHRLVYPTAVVAVVHFTWLKKLGLQVTWVYALALAVLLGARLMARWSRLAQTPV